MSRVKIKEGYEFVTYDPDKIVESDWFFFSLGEWSSTDCVGDTMRTASDGGRIIYCRPIIETKKATEGKPMNKIEHLNTKNVRNMTSSDIPYGQYFYGTVSKLYVNKLFLKTYDRIVLVEDPEYVWSGLVDLRDVIFVNTKLTVTGMTE